MAFECILDDNVQFEVFQRDSEYIGLVRVGFDAAEDANFFMVVGLSPAPPGELEYFFHLVRVEAGGAEEVVWDARRIARIISREDRAKILAVVGMLTKALLGFAAPGRFVMNTHDASTPQIAMVKYLYLNQVFRECGYKVTGCNPWNGIMSWWMDRLP